MYLASHSMNGIIPAIITKTAAKGRCSLGRGKLLSSEPTAPTLFSFGESSSMTADSEASIAPSSGTKARTYRVSLSDKLTQSLITSGLVRGITPSSVRKQLGAPIRVIASFGPAGVDVEKPEVDC